MNKNSSKQVNSAKPEDVTICVFGIDPKTNLIDRRIPTDGIVFGTIEGVARQYGIKMVSNGNLLKFTAPKSRLQIFAEKLHFSKVQYYEG